MTPRRAFLRWAHEQPSAAQQRTDEFLRRWRELDPKAYKPGVRAKLVLLAMGELPPDPEDPE